MDGVGVVGIERSELREVAAMSRSRGGG